MPIVEAKCTNCGQTLKVDNSKDAAVCEFCGSAFIVEKAINNYISNNQYKIEHANINMTDEHSVEKRLQNAEVFFKKLNQPKKAMSLFADVTEDAPGDYRGWWGIARILTKEFTLEKCNLNEYFAIKSAVNNALSVVPSSEKKEELLLLWEKEKVILNSYIKELKNKVTKVKKELGELNGYYEEQKAEVDFLKEEKDFKAKKLASSSRLIFAGVMFGMLFGFIWLILLAVDITMRNSNPVTWILFILTVISFLTPYFIKIKRSFNYKKTTSDYEDSFNKLKRISNQITLKEKEYNKEKQVLYNGTFNGTDGS